MTDGPLSFATCSYETIVAETLIDPEQVYRELDEGLAELRGTQVIQQRPPVPS